MKQVANCRLRALALVLCVGGWPSAAFATAATLPRIPPGSGDREFVRAGVVAAAVGELLDAPQLLAGADAQEFAGDGLVRLANLSPSDGMRERASLVRAEFRPSAGRFDRAHALADYGGFVKAVIGALPAKRRRLFLVGDFAQSIAYNARVLRETDADGYRATLAAISDADAGAAGLSSLRAQLGKLDAEDWTDSARLAGRAVAAIVGSSDAVPYPSARAIWTILVRSRVPTGRDAQHLALDVVWFDGHHQTFAAYPAGDDFSKNADRLTCVRDREPSIGTLHASPLVVPNDRSYDSLAASFEKSCDAFDAQPPPYVVADAGDDRFVAAVLTAAGLDPKRAMGETSAK